MRENDPPSLRSLLSAAACAVGVFVGFTTLFLGVFPLLLKPVAAELGWNRTTISGLLTIAAIFYALANPLVGRLADRFGARSVILPGLVLYAMGVGSLSKLTTNITQAYLAFVLIGAAAAMCGMVPLNNVISRTFHARRGLMLGLVMGGGSTVGTAVSVPVADAIIVHYGWRDTYLVMGAAILAAFPIVFAFLREPGSALEAPSPRGSTTPVRQTPGSSMREAVATSAFWKIFVAMLLVSAASYAFRTHSFAWFTDRRISSAVATLVLSVVALSGLLGQLISGALLDGVQSPKIAIPCFATTVAGLGLMLVSQQTWALLLSAVVLGAGIGTQMNIMPYLVSRYFGFRAYSEIVGYLGSSIAIGSGIGAVLLGLAFDRLGSYDVGLAACVGALVLGAVVIGLLGPYAYSAGPSRALGKDSATTVAIPAEPQRSGLSARA